MERNTCLHTRPFSPPASDFSGGNTPVYARIFCSFLRIFFLLKRKKKELVVKRKKVRVLIWTGLTG